MASDFTNAILYANERTSRPLYRSGDAVRLVQDAYIAEHAIYRHGNGYLQQFAEDSGEALQNIYAVLGREVLNNIGVGGAATVGLTREMREEIDSRRWRIRVEAEVHPRRLPPIDAFHLQIALDALHEDKPRYDVAIMAIQEQLKLLEKASTWDDAR
jgi:hypothetical protein